MNKRNRWLTACVAIALAGWTAVPASARPPTVGVNPGYDRRLIESRQAQPEPDVATVPAKHRKHRRHRQ